MGRYNLKTKEALSFSPVTCKMVNLRWSEKRLERLRSALNSVLENFNRLTGENKTFSLITTGREPPKAGVLVAVNGETREIFVYLKAFNRKSIGEAALVLSRTLIGLIIDAKDGIGKLSSNVGFFPNHVFRPCEEEIKSFIDFLTHTRTGLDENEKRSVVENLTRTLEYFQYQLFQYVHAISLFSPASFPKKESEAEIVGRLVKLLKEHTRQQEKLDEEDSLHNLWSIAARFAFLSIQAKAIGNYLLADKCEREFHDRVVPHLKAANSFYWLKSFGRAPLSQPNPYTPSAARDEFTFLFGMFHQFFNEYVRHRAPKQFSKQTAVLLPPAN